MMTSAVADLGLTTHAMDLEYSRKLNILSGFGFLLAVEAASRMLFISNMKHFLNTCSPENCAEIRRLVRHGLVWMAPPCASWSFAGWGP